MNEYVMAHVCTQVRTSMYGRGRGLRGPVGVGWCACDKTTLYTPTSLGLHGVRTVPIGPGGWGQRPRREPA